MRAYSEVDVQRSKIVKELAKLDAVIKKLVMTLKNLVKSQHLIDQILFLF